MYSEKRPPTSAFLPARGLKQHFLCWGDPGWVTREQPAFVLLHGYMDVARSFQFVVDALTELGEQRYVIAPDLRGFGLTRSAQDAYWFYDYAGDVDALIDHVSPGEPVDLLGHSMGGNVAMLYAGVRPQRVRRLVNLEGFGLPATAPEEAPVRIAKWLDQLKVPEQLRPYANFEAVAQRLMRNNARLSADKAAYLARYWAEERDGAVHLLGDAAHKRVNPVLNRVEEMLAFYRRISAPVLWVEGTGDEHDAWWRGTYTKAEFYTRLAQVERVQKAQLDDAGHMLHHDQPGPLAALLTAFLREPDPASSRREA